MKQCANNKTSIITKARW